MPERFAQAMHKAVSETIENMAFMEALPVASTPDWEGEELQVTSLLMHDPVQGEFRMLMSRNLLLRISEALYALPVEDLSPQVTNDTLLELLNTIAGQFLNELFPGRVYRLGLPEIETDDVDLLGNTDTSWGYRIDEDIFAMSVTGESLLAYSEAEQSA